MKIAELLSEQQLTPQQQIAKDTELMTQHILKQRQQQQQSQQQPAPAAPQKVVTPDMIVKHPQYKSWYDKYYKAEFAKDNNPASASVQAKKYADGKITRLIQQGQ